MCTSIGEACSVLDPTGIAGECTAYICICNKRLKSAHDSISEFDIYEAVLLQQEQQAEAVFVTRQDHPTFDGCFPAAMGVFTHLPSMLSCVAVHQAGSSLPKR